MMLGNMHRLGVQRLVAYCLNPSCRHQGFIDVSKHADEVEVPSFADDRVINFCLYVARRTFRSARASLAE